MKKTIDKVLVSNKMIKILDDLKVAFNANEVNEEMIEQMKTLRELFKEIELPTIVKSIRLTYEHLSVHANLDNLPYWEQEEIEIDEQNTSINYYLDLLYNPNNKYNKEEIKEMNVMLKEIAES
jgi:hypothetical protein